MDNDNKVTEQLDDILNRATIGDILAWLVQEKANLTGLLVVARYGDGHTMLHTTVDDYIAVYELEVAKAALIQKRLDTIVPDEEVEDNG